MPKLTIDVVSDIVCPFCLIGARRLDDALAATPGVDATVRFHPFLLDPSIPKEGVDLRANLAKKFGGDPKAMFGRVEAMARESGIPLDFEKVRRYPSTVAAHTLIRHADAKGTQRAVARALFEAYFLNEKDVSDPATLGAIGAAHGFSADEVIALVTDEKELAATRKEAGDAAEQGISGVPFFVFAEKYAVSGAQPVEILKQAIAKAAG